MALKNSNETALKNSNDEPTHQGSIFDDKRLREVWCTKVISTRKKNLNSNPKP